MYKGGEAGGHMIRRYELFHSYVIVGMRVTLCGITAKLPKYEVALILTGLQAS